MRLLLDTHTLIWWLLDRDELSRKAFDAIKDEANPVFVSAASAFEISIKHRIGKFPEVAALLGHFEQRIGEQLFDELPITIRHGRAAGGLPGAHKDPFDRMLAAQALTEGLVMVSSDEAMDGFGVQRLW